MTAKQNGTDKMEAVLTKALEGIKPENIPEFAIRPYYESKADGVYFVGVETGKESQQARHKDPERLGSALQLVGRGTDHAGEYYRVIRWTDKLTRQERTEVLPMGIIGTSECWQFLQSKGITVLSRRSKRDLLADYLQNEGSNDCWTVTAKAGWCGDCRAYILPGGEVLKPAEGGQAGHVIFKGDKSQAACFREGGTLADWQEGIGRYAEGNSRLCLAIGSAFAAPLMRLAGIEGGGFHLFGDSSDGKTTAALAALSVWGKADELKMGWRGTDLGFSNVANARNDGFLVLDEIGEATPHIAGKTAYSVLNGRGKIQGAAAGGNRPVDEWRVLVLSTGEKTLETFLRAPGMGLHAGQAARLPSIPANAGKGYGVYDTLHGFADGALLSEHLNRAANSCYGTAGRAFVRAILADPEAAKESTQEAMRAFTDELLNATGQARRVVMRFALVSAALEMAARFGIMPLTAVQIRTAVRQCLDDWLVREGTGKREDKTIIEQAAGWMQIHARSDRFVRYPTAPHDTMPPNHAGYILQKDTEKQDRFYIVPVVFEGELGKGFDAAKVCDVLAAVGWLEKNDTKSEKRVKHRLRSKGRFYVLCGEQPPSEDED